MADCDGITERYPLVMASTVDNMNNSLTQKVRLLNPSSDPVSINQGSGIGRAERYEDFSVLVESEDLTRSGNNNAVRRIQLISQYEKAGESRVAANTLQSKVSSHLVRLCSHARTSLLKK